jgi:hypothetical protein
MGYRVKRRTMRRSKVGKRHIVTSEEAMAFAASRLQTNIVREGVTVGETETQ